MDGWVEAWMEAAVARQALHVAWLAAPKMGCERKDWMSVRNARLQNTESPHPPIQRPPTNKTIPGAKLAAWKRAWKGSDKSKRTPAPLHHSAPYCVHRVSALSGPGSGPGRGSGKTRTLSGVLLLFLPALPPLHSVWLSFPQTIPPLPFETIRAKEWSRAEQMATAPHRPNSSAVHMHGRAGGWLLPSYG